MAEFSTAEPAGDTGQGGVGSETTTNDTTQVSTEGQSAETGTEGATATDPTQTATEDTFATSFDPKELPEELQTAYRQMQGDYTRKTSEIAAMRQYKDIIDNFQRDPVGTLRQLNQQYGIGQSQSSQSGPDFDNFEPQSWGEVAQALQQSLMPAIMQQIDQRYQPVVGKVREMTQQTIESRLEKIDPDWRQHEANMSAILQRHPSMVNDLDGLYRLSVPPEVLQAKATQAAMRKIQGKADNSKVSGATNNTKTPDDGPPRGVSFAESAAWAKAKLARDGITPP